MYAEIEWGVKFFFQADRPRLKKEFTFGATGLKKNLILWQSSTYSHLN
jgi:hypothetical protein